MSARVLAAGSVLAAVAQAYGYGNGTATTGDVYYTTEVVTALTTYCPLATTLTYNDKTYTVTEATTLTITDCPCTISKPVEPTATPSHPQDKCAKQCSEEYNQCRGSYDANMATCAGQYASCLGYSPYGPDGSLITPTACSAKPTGEVHTTYTTEVVTSLTTYCPEPTTLTYNNKTYTVTEPTTLTITDCPCTVTKPCTTTGPAPTAPAVTLSTTTIVPGKPGKPEVTQPAKPAGDCPAECAAAYSDCRGAVDANMSTCAAAYASCLGYSPFGPDGSLVTPTACSSAATGTVVVPTNPPAVETPTGPSEVPTAGAGRVVPGALLVLGAIALL